jgi:predicted HTH transcriptional regulator
MSQLSHKERADKIATLQRCIDEAEESGAGVRSMVEILAAARRKVGGKTLRP